MVIARLQNQSITALAILGISFAVCFPVYANCLASYLSQVGNIPTRVAEGVISTSEIEYNTAIDVKNSALYFTRPTSDFSERHIMVSQCTDAGFSNPQPLLLDNKHYQGSDVSVSPNGQLLLFKTRHNLGALAARKDGNIYVSQRNQNVWGAPEPVSSNVNSALGEYYPVQTQSGNLYFSRELKDSSYDIYVAKWQRDHFEKAVPLSSSINTELLESDAYIAPDESYMIFVRMYAKDGLGVSDLYISFNKAGKWTEAKHMGNEINSIGVDGSPFVTADGNYLFFTSTRDSNHPTEFDGGLDLYVVKIDIDKYR